jgi:DnaJ-class molecular chaperone
MEFKDYYSVLGVSKTATDEEIKRAYRKLARKHHPDLNPGDKSAETRFKDINEANEVLGDPEKRRKYDELGANWRQYEQQGTPPRASGFGTGPGGYRTVTPEDMEQMFGEETPFSDFFSTFFGGSGGDPRTGGRRGRAARAQRGHDVEATTDLTLEEAFAGTTRKVTLMRDGKDHTVEVRIPAGIKDGARVRASGEGTKAEHDASAGDLYLSVRVLPHPRFERRDQDLYAHAPILVTTAVLGGEVTVTTLSGSTLRLKIPPMTTSGRVFRLRGHGMPAVGKPAERGDLYVTVDIQIPTQITPEERQHYEALQALATGQKVSEP